MLPSRGLLGLLLLLLTCGCGDDDQGGFTPDSRGPSDLGQDRQGADLKPPLDSAPLRPDGPTTMGAACTADQHCSAGLTCDLTQPGGMCTRTCTGDAQCSGGQWGCFSGSCRAKCNPRSPLNDCRASYVCRLESGKASCTADCRVKACEAPLTCDNKSGHCLNPKGGTLGAACGMGIGDCSGTPNGVCLAVISMTSAYCTLPCSPFTAPCPTDVAGASCAAGNVKGEYCIFTCDSKTPKCPHKDMKCKKIGSYELCVQP